MKLILLVALLTSLTATDLAAAPRTLLQCLGREEQLIHQNKIEGPVYALNQAFILELTTLDQVPLKNGKLKEICRTKSKFSPSVNLLKTLLLDGTSIFDLSEKDERKRLINKMAIESVEAAVPNLFFSYLSNLQGTTQNPFCLDKKIPELSFFLNRYKSLEPDLAPEALLEEKHKIRKIFLRLENFEKILEACKKMKKKPQ